MKAAVFHQFGGPEVLQVEEVPMPEPGPGQVRIRVHAVTVNQGLDVVLRRGESGLDVRPPMVPGIDPAGVVDAVGPDVNGLAVGDRVAASLPPTVSGGYAEYAVVSAASAVRVPPGLDFGLAACVNRHYPAALAQMRVAAVQPGETVLVMGAAGALASCLVQLAKQAGATVIAGAGAPSRVQAALDLGADHGVNYREQSLVEVVRRLTDGKGVAVVLENVGEPSLWQQALACLARGGRLITIGTHGGSGVLPVDIRLLYRNRLTIRSGLSDRPVAKEETAAAMELAAQGRLRMRIDRVLPLSQAAEAHRLVETNVVTGKVVIDPTLG